MYITCDKIHNEWEIEINQYNLNYTNIDDSIEIHKWINNNVTNYKKTIIKYSNKSYSIMSQWNTVTYIFKNIADIIEFKLKWM